MLCYSRGSPFVCVPLPYLAQHPFGSLWCLCRTSFELPRAVQDIRAMRTFLQRNGFEAKDIVMLCDEDPHYPPTRDNFVQALRWLAQGVRQGDSLFFAFSGHCRKVRCSFSCGFFVSFFWHGGVLLCMCLSIFGDAAACSCWASANLLASPPLANGKRDD